LRETRQQRGEDLYDVADYLRIKPSYLFALEEGDLRSMPGRTYAMGFLRTYADHLGFDGAEVVRGLKQKATAEVGEALQVRQPVAPSRLPSVGVLLLALLLAGFAYGGWFAAQSGGTLLSQLRAIPGEIGEYAARMFEDEERQAVEARERQLVVSSDVQRPVVEDRDLTAASTAATVAVDRRGASASPSAAATSGPVTAFSAGEASAAISPSTAETSRKTDITAAISATASTDPAPSGSGAADGTNGASDPLASLILDAEAERRAALRRLQSERPEGGTVGELLAGLTVGTDESLKPDASTEPVLTSDTGRVVLLAREPSWIQVQSPSRDFVRSLTLEPGQRFELPGRKDLALWTGNAGGLEVWVDGQSVGVLGQSGAVLRDISLAPEALLARR
jgi:cytoskeleton protein RodZ